MTVTIPLGCGAPLVEATFVARPNRFLVEALLDGAIVQAHLADRGRLKETLLPNVRLLLARHSGTARKTAFQAVAAYREVGDLGVEPCEQHAAASLKPQAASLTSLDTHLPNRLIEAALRANALPQFLGYSSVRREVQIGASRFDFQLADGPRRCTLEVKSAGLVEHGVALFPDAPTDRGRRHLRELAELARAGQRAAVLFVAQGTARAVAINRAIDPQFADELARVAADGVEVYACACPLTPAGISLGPAVPVQV